MMKKRKEKTERRRKGGDRLAREGRNKTGISTGAILMFHSVIVRDKVTRHKTVSTDHNF